MALITHTGRAHSTGEALYTGQLEPKGGGGHCIHRPQTFKGKKAKSLPSKGLELLLTSRFSDLPKVLAVINSTPTPFCQSAKRLNRITQPFTFLNSTLYVQGG